MTEGLFQDILSAP